MRPSLNGNLPFSLKENQVYYWRVRLENIDPPSWSTASFKYIPGKTGWAQAKFPQFLENSSKDLELNEFQEKFIFASTVAEFEFIGERGGQNFIYNKNGILKDNASLNGFSLDGLVWVIIDPKTLDAKSGSVQLGTLESAIVPSQLFKLREAIFNMNDGDYIAIGNRLNPKVPIWDQSTFDALKEIGVSDKIKLLGNNENFILLGQKGNPVGSAIEVYAPNSGDNLLIQADIFSQKDEGSVNSTRIGPALSWDNVLWDWNSIDATLLENADLNIYGQKNTGENVLLHEKIGKGNFDLSGIDAQEYPYLVLESKKVDSVFLTSPQLDNWHVFYEPTTDAVVDLATNFRFDSDTIFEGQDIVLNMGARNIGNKDLDSMEVALLIERADRSRLILDTLTIAPLVANGPTVEFEYRLNSLEQNLKGDVLFVVELNPRKNQPESNFFNNLFVKNFFVVNDNRNPIMDVTFDGKHIMDGDIVSPQPEILIEVNDENEYVALDDSTTFELYFKEGVTAGTQFERVFINGDPRVEFQAGQLPENKARLYFNPGEVGKLEDGDYTLRVQGKDKNGNAAGQGANFYEIRFRVENSSTVTQVLNYPNPFSTSTRFVYTLTGADLPEIFQIHIYTISGRMVKMIDLVELGEVFYGHNMTNYTWDGTDEFGDRLANGVYLYKVVMKMPGDPIEVIDDKTSRYFNNGWGKMVIMR